MYCYNIILYSDFLNQYVSHTEAKELWAQIILISLFTLDRFPQVQLLGKQAVDLFQQANTALVQLVYSSDKF